MQTATKIRKHMDNKTTMEEVFSGSVKINTQEPSRIPVELGYGRGIGIVAGAYNMYCNSVRDKGTFKNTLMSMGKDIVQNDAGELIAYSDNTNNEYYENDVPVITLKFFNLINSVSINLLWDDKDKNNSFIPSYYLIPTPRSMGYKWWDVYDIYFYIPESMSKGDHSVNVLAKDVNTTNTIMSSIDFSIKCNGTNKNNNNND